MDNLLSLAGASGGVQSLIRPSFVSPLSVEVCGQYVQSGECFYGDKCQYLHPNDGPSMERSVSLKDHQNDMEPYLVALTQQAPTMLGGMPMPQQSRFQESKLATYLSNRHRNVPVVQVPSVSTVSRSLMALGLDQGAVKRIPEPGNDMLQHVTHRPSSSGPYTNPIPPLTPGSPSPSLSPSHQLQQNSSPEETGATISTYQESVGGTTYFYTADDSAANLETDESDTSNLEVTPMMTVLDNVNAGVKLRKGGGSNSIMFIAEDIKAEILKSNLLKLGTIDPEKFPDIPTDVEDYHGLVPLEATPTAKSTTFGYITSVYKAFNNLGECFCLNRVHGFRFIGSKAMVLLDVWKRISHSNIVQLKEAFTTEEFGDISLVFVYNYLPGVETLLTYHFTPPSSHNAPNGVITPFQGENRPYSHNSNAKQKNHKRGGPVPETVLWAYIIQLSAALRTIHAAGLACRSLDPTKVLIHSLGQNKSGRLWISSCGIFDVLSFDPSCTNPLALMPHYQQEDLVALGKVLLALACNSLTSIQRDQLQTSVDLVSRSYSSDLRNVIVYLLSSGNHRGRSINDIMPMIGARFYTQLDTIQLRSDSIRNELSKEIDNGRLFRLMVKLAMINERPEHNLDPSWSETGDRYMLKLFRDYVFHPVTEDGKPWIDLAHVVSCLNKLDVGVSEKICLTSRDEQSVLIVTYAELKQCLESSFNELIESSNTIKEVKDQ